MFHLVCVGWLFFRAESFGQAAGMLAALAAAPAVSAYAIYGSAMLAFFVAPLLVYEWRMERKRDLRLLTRTSPFEQAAVYAYLVFMIVLFPPLASQPFIYFQF
jgi:D-alanyl-lipoteichoic acid acyltransferase DltB (MBOAT superfamily)